MIGIKRKKKPLPASRMSIRGGHFSLQFSDTGRQKAHDVRKMFVSKCEFYTGTEAGKGAGKTHGLLKKGAKENDYWFHGPWGKTSTWVAVSKHFMPRKPKMGYIPVIPRGGQLGDPHRFDAKGILWLEGDTAIGRVAIVSTHMLTKGRHKGQSKKDDARCPKDHWEQNNELSRTLRRFVRDCKRRGVIVFGGLDSNRDAVTTNIWGIRPMPVVINWDERNRYPGTGHGCIDALFRSKTWKVRCTAVRRETDNDEFYYTDHFPIFATYLYDVTNPKKAKARARRDAAERKERTRHKSLSG